MESFYPKLIEIVKTMSRKGYVVFQDPKGFDLNIVGIRTQAKSPNAFDDFMCVFYKQNEEWTFHVFNCTTDPGTYYLENPLNVEGTAIVKEGQYRGLYRIGFHRGKYEALVQSKEITVYRDLDRNREIDYRKGTERTGFFGINIHRASEDRTSTEVDKWSAGCQVFSCSEQFKMFMMLCRKGRDNFGNSFTYTLLNENDFHDGV